MLLLTHGKQAATWSLGDSRSFLILQKLGRYDSQREWNKTRTWIFHGPIKRCKYIFNLLLDKHSPGVSWTCKLWVVICLDLLISAESLQATYTPPLWKSNSRSWTVKSKDKCTPWGFSSQLQWHTGHSVASGYWGHQDVEIKQRTNT